MKTKLELPQKARCLRPYGSFTSPMRMVALLALTGLVLQQTAVGVAQEPAPQVQAPEHAPLDSQTGPVQSSPLPPGLQIVIIEGEDVSNNIKERTAREPIVQVQDENHKPVAGALVLFTVSSDSGNAGGAFLGGARTFSVQTDATGRAVGQGFKPNGSAGHYHISVDASKGSLKSHVAIAQQNVVVASSAAASGGIVGFVATHVLLTTLVVAGVVAGTTVAAVKANQTSSTTITPGTGTVGAPASAGIRINLGHRH